MTAAASAMLNGALAPTYKNITEGFDPDYGRMYVVLGSTPNPLTPGIGAGPVVGLAQYIDPPTEFLTPDQPVLWQITHLGVDSHALHFHLFDVQVINRFDWANIVKAPYPEEVGWKDTIRTNPFEDILIALKPSATVMKLPFGIPDSIRLLDPSTVAGSTANFLPVAPPVGVPAVAQLSNVLTNFGWEYVFHCHLLGHEEHDMMRPVVFQVPSTIPTAPALTAVGRGGVKLTWTDATPFDYSTGLPVTTLGNPANEVGFKILRGTGTTGALTQIATAPANTTTYTDTTVTAGSTYGYQIQAYNAAGSSSSNTVNVRAAGVPPTAPSNLAATAVSQSTTRDRVTLTWTDNSNNETGFTIQRAATSAFTGVSTATAPAAAGTGATVTFTQSGLRKATTYWYRVAATGSGGTVSAWSNAVSITTP
jgi:FtsP/CotA-like multicopper oxidase with cupredoxin domain